MEKIKAILTATNPQKILDFLCDHQGEELTEKDIRKAAKISKSGTNYALRDLEKTAVLVRKGRGKIYFYSLGYKNPVVKQLKVLKTVVYIQPVINKLKELSSKVILFGSAARGEDVSNSDIDLFVISNNKKETIEEQISKLKIRRKLQLVVRTELAHTEFKIKDPVFYAQVQQGIILWQKE